LQVTTDTAEGPRVCGTAFDLLLLLYRRRLPTDLDVEGDIDAVHRLFVY
jgi:hypothetical protein